MDAMTTSKKTAAREELDRIEEAFVQAILDSSEADLREDMKAADSDPNVCIEDINALIGRVEATCSKRRFDQAKSELAAWRSGEGKIVNFDRDTVRARFEGIRARDPDLASKMMMAARKGEGISDRDMEGLLEDLAKLDILERKDGKE
jgi:hypothetical protein